MTARRCSMIRALHGDFVFCLAAAAAGVTARFVFCDHVYFRLQEVPGHDLSQGLAFFATSMHSMRSFGDLAWWFPGSATGYAQYYQGFLAPLAPTYGHVAFIVWAQLVGLAGVAGLAIPEYMQYLAVTYLVLPFLSFAAFAWFCTLVLRRRESVVLALIAYVVSGIGLWNSAWFYFQESFSVFFLLASTLAAVRRPRASAALVWMAAVLVQLASLNYWTVYNIFFVAIILGAHAATHLNQWRRAVRRLAVIAWRHPRASAALAGAFAVTAFAWAVLLGAVAVEQAGTTVRQVYGVEDALGRIKELRRSTTELFNPVLERATANYPMLGPIHSARYIGITLLPLVVIGAFAAFDRRGRWLVSTAILLLAVSMGFPAFVALWSAIPFMDRIQHVFYFYSHYWQIALVLLAGVGLDHVLRADSKHRGRFIRIVLGVGVAGSLAIFAWATLWSHEFKADDASLEALLRAALFGGLGSALLLCAARLPLARGRRFAVIALVTVTFIDLGTYFQHATRADMAYTRSMLGFSLDPARRDMLRRAWGAPQPQRGFHAGLEPYMPIANFFWPANVFLIPAAIPGPSFVPVHTYVVQAAPPAFLFYGRARLLPAQAILPKVQSWAELEALDAELLVEHARPDTLVGDTSFRVDEGFSFAWKRWAYNGFTVDVVAPRDGWLKVRQQLTPHWRFRIDGTSAEAVKANYIETAVPLARGSHTVEWDYWPLSRRLYWPAAVLLEAVLAAFLIVAARARLAQPVRRAAPG